MKKTYKIAIILLGVLLIASFLIYKFQPAERVHAIPSISQTNTKNINPIKIPNFYNQRDKRWASDKLGNTNETVGKVGCLVSSICMNISYYQQTITPKELNRKLREVKGYTDRGWLIWSKLEEVTNNKLSISFPKLSHKSIETSLLANKPILAKVYINKVIPHWVLIVGKKNNEYLMLDPLTQGELNNVTQYGEYIYSIRVLENK